MAELKLLQGGIQKQLGAMYGYRRNGKNIISAVPFSHAPHSPEQKAAFSAFSKVQKLNGSLARLFSPYMSLNTRKMLAVNAVAKITKPLIANKEFHPENFPTLFSRNNSFEVQSAEYTDDLPRVTLVCHNSYTGAAGKKDMLYIGLFGEDYRQKSASVYQIEEGDYDFSQLLLAKIPLFVITLKSSFNGSKWVLCDGGYHEINI